MQGAASHEVEGLHAVVFEVEIKAFQASAIDLKPCLVGYSIESIATSKV